MVRERIGELSIVHGVLLKLSRIIVPSCMKLQVRGKIREGLQGITKCREPASGGGGQVSVNKYKTW